MNKYVLCSITKVIVAGQETAFHFVSSECKWSTESLHIFTHTAANYQILSEI